jgi:hypothetical protein
VIPSASPDLLIYATSWKTAVKMFCLSADHISCSFENQLSGEILGPIRSDDGHWRIKTNQEISDILKGQKTKTEMVGPC